MTNSFKNIGIILLLILISGCKKSGFLDAKPDQSLVVPSTLEDLQALLDNDQVMNGAGNLGNVPVLGDVGCDDYYITENDFLLSATLQQNAYTWATDIYSGEKILDWDYPYRSVFYSNVALDELAKLSVSSSQQQASNNIKGSALFYRAHAFYQLAQIFAPSFNPNSADTDMGIPLRMHADINESVQRVSLNKTYQQIEDDLKEALPLLPDLPLYKTRPSKAAVFALLARFFLNKQEYEKASLYADSCLALQKGLMDFNAIDSSVLFPIKRFNEEVIFHTTIITDKPIVLEGRAKIDTILYNSYEQNDLRKAIFFKPALPEGMSARGSYDGSPFPFGGLTTDEVYLIKAECNARLGNVAAAMEQLNTLLATRWRTSTFVPFVATDVSNALSIILAERRKELIFRGLRWSDLRRLNEDPGFAKTLTRKMLGITYELQPLSQKYTYPIPDDVIGFNPSMPQNPR